MMCEDLDSDRKSYLQRGYTNRMQYGGHLKGSYASQTNLKLVFSFLRLS